MSEPIDGELLRAWSSGDRNAAAQLVRRHSRDLFRFFVSRAPDDVDDLMQQTLLDCAEYSREGNTVDNFRALLFTIARRRLVDHLRKQGGRPEVRYETDGAAAERTTPSEHLARARNERDVLEALRTLPLDVQILLELFYWHELSGADLAQIMEIPEGTLRGRLRSARNHLARKVDEIRETNVPIKDTLTRLAEWKSGALPDPPGDAEPVIDE